MDTQRAFLAVILSLAILFGYQYFFMPETQYQEQQVAVVDQGGQVEGQAELTAAPVPVSVSQVLPPANPNRTGKEIVVETNLYRAVIAEDGGGFKSFSLKAYREEMVENSGDKELIPAQDLPQLPLFFSWGPEPAQAPEMVYQANKDQLQLASGKGQLILSSRLESGIEIHRIMTFSADDYLIDLVVKVVNNSEHQIHGAPFLAMVNTPLSFDIRNQFLFQGPAYFADDLLVEVDVDDLEGASQTKSGKIDWLAYEDTYFMTAVMPDNPTRQTVTLAAGSGDQVISQLSSPGVTLNPHTEKDYRYSVYFGPKKLDVLQGVGSNLDKIVNFGWFDILAKPMLSLLKFLYGVIPNYGLAIILVTIVIKALFWPIAQKGMKSMKTMQKLQPKMAKLREKYKDDKERLNREMMQLYQTYKVNPVGGCLPMVLQIPVFFALYKVLLQTIELRHAPFMLWITDLSAPDRLFIGIDIPYLGGIPVLTLLMGASMFLQQKMTPTTGDPTQAKVMKFLPVIFTFMFLNFASGLVLYWFVNNLLSIGQQYAVNRSKD